MIGALAETKGFPPEQELWCCPSARLLWLLEVQPRPLNTTLPAAFRSRLSAVNADYICHNHALSKLRLGPLHRILTRAPPRCSAPERNAAANPSCGLGCHRGSRAAAPPGGPLRRPEATPRPRTGRKPLPKDQDQKLPGLETEKREMKLELEEYQVETKEPTCDN